VRALRVSMVQHVETKDQATRVNVLMDFLVIDVILEVSLFVNIMPCPRELSNKMSNLQC
jgi:hypothetical protein